MTEKTAPTIKKKSKKPLRTTGGHFASTKSPFDGLPLSENVKTRLILIAEMRKYGFTKEQTQTLLLELYREVVALSAKDLKGTPVVQGSSSKKDATQLVPVSNIQASSLTPNFETIRSFFLTGHQKHPKYPDWLSAEEIGAPIGLNADQVKKYSTEYAKDHGFDISNNVASEKVKAAGGYMKGVATLIDECSLPCYVNLEIGCAGIWYLMEDGKIVWRNYWSPIAVADILQRIPESKKKLSTNGPLDSNYLPPGVNFEQTVEGQATVTPVKQ